MNGKMEELRARMNDANASIQYASGNKLCPFQSQPGNPVRCSSECMLFRSKKPNFECPFLELPAISFSLSPLQGRR